MKDLIDRAAWIAETVLLPDAGSVDTSGVIPPSHFRVLADEGFFGVCAPDSGIDPRVLALAIEHLAGGCLATTFTWVQHHLAVAMLASAANTQLRAKYFADLISGEQFAGNASAGALTDPPRLRAARTAGGWIFDGEAPFVSGWGTIDVLLLLGRTPDGIVTALVDPHGVDATPYELLTLDATATVRLRFTESFVPDDATLGEIPLQELAGIANLGSRLTAALSTGIAIRCARELESLGRADEAEAIEADVVVVRAALDAALDDAAQTYPARAASAHLAHRAATALCVVEGGASLTRGGKGQRHLREAVFTMVAGSRPQMKARLLELLVTGPDR